MQTRMWTIVGLILCGIALAAACEVPPPDTGKLGWDLFQEVSEMEHRSATGEEVESLTAFLMTDQPLTGSDADELAQQGYTLIGAYGNFALVSAPGTLYSDPDRGLDALGFVTTAMLPPTFLMNDYHTEGVAAIGADVAHQLDHRGQGTKIAVIDGGFEPANPLLQEMEPHYCCVGLDSSRPEKYVAREGEVAMEHPHGTSCAIIAADVAPEAEFYLISFDQDDSLVGWLFALYHAAVKLDVDIISCSLEFLMPTCHADGTGLLNDAVHEILEETDTVMALASGNWAMGNGSGKSFYGGTFANADDNFLHDFTPDAEKSYDRGGLRFHACQGDRVAIVLEWDDWNRETGSVDLDLFLSFDAYQVGITAARAQQFERTTPPVEVLSLTIPYTGYYSLSIEDRAAKWHGQPETSVSFHLNLSNASHAFETVEHHMSAGSTREVATNTAVVSVGAVSLAKFDVLPYSSRGLTADGRSAPELCGPSGVTGTTYELFHGTSAAAPYVAGAFAVLKSAFPEMTSEQLRQHMVDTARCSVDECGNTVCVVDLEAAVQPAED